MPEPAPVIPAATPLRKRGTFPSLSALLYPDFSNSVPIVCTTAVTPGSRSLYVSGSSALPLCHSTYIGERIRGRGGDGREYMRGVQG